MNPENSVTQYINRLKKGDQMAATRIWERFIYQLVALAYRKLRLVKTTAVDEEDVVQNAFSDFFLQVSRGKFPRLDDREDLWQVLVMLVDRRATDQIRKQKSKKAGEDRIHNESVFLRADETGRGNGLDAQMGLVPTVELAAETIELFKERMDSLSSDEHRQVARLKMEGYSTLEIAEKMGSSLRTIERWLARIRKTWSAELIDD